MLLPYGTATQTGVSAVVCAVIIGIHNACPFISFFGLVSPRLFAVSGRTVYKNILLWSKLCTGTTETKKILWMSEVRITLGLGF